MKKTKKFEIIILSVCILLLLTACGGSSSKWGVEATTGKYMMSENGEYPYILVTKYEYINEFEEETTGLAISVYVDDMRHGLSNDEAEQREDGTYYLEGSNWSYIVSFNGNGQAKVEMEETGENGLVNAISKSMYKKAVGTYKYFEESTKTFNEAIEDAYNELEYGTTQPGMIVENVKYSATDFVDIGRTYVSKENDEMIFLNAWYAVSFSQKDINIEAMFTQNRELDRRSLTLNLSNTEETPLTYYVNNSDGYLERDKTLTINEDGSLSIQYTEDGIDFSGVYYLAIEEDVEAYKNLLEQVAEKVVLEEEAVESAENTEAQGVVHGTYSFDNEADAVMQGDVGIYTDSGEDYIYLAALYYDSNHYTAEIEGVLEPLSSGVYYVKDAISGVTELEIMFLDGGMNVNILYADTEKYEVLEGYYELISELNFDKVG